MTVTSAVHVDPIRPRCTGFGLRDWPSQIPQSKRFIVDFSVVWGEVNFHLFLLLLYGLECSTVVGGGGVVRECCRMLICNIFGVGDGSSILPIKILLGRADVFTRYFPHSIPYMFNRRISWQLWDIVCPWLAFLQIEKSPSLCLWPSEGW